MRCKGTGTSTRFRDPFTDNRTPDFIAITAHGLIYTGGTKLAEHGGFAHDDRSVALLVSAHSLSERTIDEDVRTTQIAPTILRSLGLNPERLEGVRNEHTRALPGLEDVNERHERDRDHDERHFSAE